MIWLTAIGIYFVIAAVVIIAVCALSARMSQHEDWGETPIVEARGEPTPVRDYQTDAASFS
jgi:predicted secreted protein